jgi:hypothetical protein
VSVDVESNSVDGSADDDDASTLLLSRHRHQRAEASKAPLMPRSM